MPPLTVTLAFVSAILVILFLSVSKFSRRDHWIATVTPLASIIGSGFLISGPILAKEFGAAAAPAMLVLLLIAYALGAVIRYNIAHIEPLMKILGRKDPISRLAQVSQVTLAIAYAISVAYYLKLLAAFILRAVGFETPLLSNLLVTAIIGLLVLIALTGSLRRVEHIAHASVSAKIGLIVGMLVALAVEWVLLAGEPLVLPPTQINVSSVALLLGLLITIQGFETSRYMGDLYGRSTRIETMREAQLISSMIYLAFLVLLTPFLGAAAQTEGVAGILDLMEGIAPALGLLVLGGALASQLSAAVADSIGATGIGVELSDRRLSVPQAFIGASLLAIAVTWLTDPFMVVAVASRAFAVYYGVQCLLGFVASRRRRHPLLQQAGMLAMFLVCVVAALTGAPAE